jgi:hypothetical protein
VSDGTPPEAKKVFADEVLQEFVPVGKYRIRLLKDPKRGVKTLDIREYATGDGFEGYTRRGIRLTENAQLRLLRDAITDIIDGKKLDP